MRITLNFWFFFAITTLSTGLLGRYLAALLKGYLTPGIVLMTLLLAVLAAFSVTVLLRILRASTPVGRVETARAPVPATLPAEAES